MNSGLFALLFFLSIIFIPVAVIKPSILEKLFRHKFTRKSAGLLSFFFAVISFILVGVTADSTETKSVEEVIADTKDSDTFHVVRVIDGDTIELDGGIKVRYIGIDTPETVNPNTVVECYGNESSAKNKELVEDKDVRLEKDISETDRYGRLLRYVYVGDVFVNDYLVRQGYANASSYPPDIKYQDVFLEAEKEARDNNRGLWSSCKTNTITNPIPVVIPLKETNTSGKTKYKCDCKKTCPNISSCNEAQYLLNECGCTARDGDKDGIACDGEPLNCQN